jgi:hypothetical protein
MSISRRKFLHAGSLFVVCAGVPLKIFAGESLDAATTKAKSMPVGASATSSLAALNSEIFSRHLNTNFSLAHDHGKSVVSLIEVNHWQGGPANGLTAKDGRECFSLVFRGPANEALRQNTYQVTHDSLGKFDLLVVPMASRKQGSYYEALFNRLH